MRLVLGFILFFQITFAAEFTYPDFKQCYARNQDSFVYFGSLRAVAVGKNLAIAYSKTKPTHPYIKHDPFLNLYLFSSKKELKPVRLKSTSYLKVGEWIAGMDEQSLFAGNLAKEGDVLNTMYLQNASLEPNSIIACLCCDVYGLGIGKGEFIGSEYIKRFISEKEIFYGDIGARFEQKANKFYVSELDPFYENQKLLVGDEIVKVDGKKVSSLKSLNQKILFAKPNSHVNFEVLRTNKALKISSLVLNRNGGGALEDTFLEKKGLFFTQDLKLKMVKEDTFAFTNGLKAGDQLLQINQMDIKSISHLRQLLGKFKGESINLLFDRDDFQFFVNLTL
ncbi:MAG: serine protease Do [Sulfurospirillum sp.]|jgi:hypothetical protein|nr:serine protease Do [Sulfurospirillum sp.]DAB34540.1 MAG TPA: hypothetical protein CFH82_04710 [Sulfurospirillum sp. UBA12182]